MLPIYSLLREIHSHCCITITTIHLQNIFIFPVRNSVPIKHWWPTPLPQPTLYYSMVWQPWGTSAIILILEVRKWSSENLSKVTQLVRWLNEDSSPGLSGSKAEFAWFRGCLWPAGCSQLMWVSGWHLKLGDVTYKSGLLAPLEDLDDLEAWAVFSLRGQPSLGAEELVMPQRRALLWILCGALQHLPF